MRIGTLSNSSAHFPLSAYRNSSNVTEDAKTNNIAVFYLWASIVVAILSPVAVAGNSLVLAAIWRNSSLRTPSYILLAGLAFTDFCTGLISQPFYVAHNLVYLTGPQTSDLGPYLENRMGDGFAEYFTYLTILIITLMSIERWLHMSRRSLITLRRACVAIAVLLLMPTPLVVYRVIRGTRGVSLGIATVSVLSVCIIFTSAAYFKVFLIIRHHQHQVQASELSQSVPGAAINLAKYKKSILSILYILAVFYIGYLPLAMAGLLWLVRINTAYKHIVLFLDISVVIVFSTSSLNPLLYLWRMKDIRNEVVRLVKRMLCKGS